MTTLFKEKRPAKDLAQILTTNKPGQQGKQFKYLPDAQLEKHMAKIHDYNFATTVDEHGRNACKQAAKGFAFVIPYIDRYAMDMKNCGITEQHLIRHYKDVWHELPEQYRNKIRKAAKKYNKDVSATIQQLQDFVDHHSKHLNSMPDEQVEQVLDLEENEVEVHLTTNIRSYIKPTESKDDNKLMTPTQISEYLIQQSKGTCIHWPHQIGKELLARGFKKSDYANAYFVELV